jgi:hypothetical protein
MNRENALKWIEALRSGEFRQARHKLLVHNYDTNEDSNCCLGVAARLMSIDVPRGTEENNLASIYRDVAEWLGLEIANKPRDPDDHDSAPFNACQVYTRMNDVDGKSFEEIADFVEAELAKEAA